MIAMPSVRWTGNFSSQSAVYIATAIPICLLLFRQVVWRALSRAWAKTGKRIAARMAMIAITTRSSINVKPCRRRTAFVLPEPKQAFGRGPCLLLLLSRVSSQRTVNLLHAGAGRGVEVHSMPAMPTGKDSGSGQRTTCVAGEKWLQVRWLSAGGYPMRVAQRWCRGFTLIELLVVIAIIAILAA